MELFDSAEMKSKIQKVRERIEQIAQDPLLENLRAFYMMGLITPILDELGADPAVIVGGHAFELYTSGVYRTADVDLVIVRDDLAKALFDRLGFDREGRYYYSSQLDIPIEIPDSRLAGSLDRIVKVNTPEGYCYVIGVEDLILDRLNRAEFWQDARSEEWVRYLISSQMESLDMAYLHEKAGEEHPKLLQRLRDTINWVKQNMKD